MIINPHNARIIFISQFSSHPLFPPLCLSLLSVCFRDLLLYNNPIYLFGGDPPPSSEVTF